MKELPGVSHPYTVEVDGRTWNLYIVDYTTADGKFSVYMYALSFEHANMMLQELKETAVIAGQCMGAYKA